jgi:cytochrome b6-f complex iron-sulfur subunit
MDRKEFLKNLGLGVAGICVLNSIPACRNRDALPIIDFTIDLSDPTYDALNNLGGQYVFSQYNVLVAKGVTGYIAVSSLCTHQNCTLNYQPAQDELVCPCHGSRFNTQGGVTMGPATGALMVYATQQFGTQLRIYTP